MTTNTAACRNNGKGKWAYHRDHYPDLSLKDRADLDAHIARDHCIVCRHARDRFNAEDALRAVAPELRRRFEQQVAREAAEVKGTVMANVMAYWDDLSQTPPERQQQPKRLRQPVRISANTASESRRPSFAERPPLRQRIAAFVTASCQALWRLGARRVGSLAVGAMLAAVAIPALVVVWRKHSRMSVIPKRLAQRRIRLRHAALLISMVILAGSAIAGCLLATTLLNVMLQQEKTGWWRLALATSSTTALSTVVFGVGVIFTSRYALKGYGWMLGTLGRLLLADDRSANLSYLLHEATVRASLGVNHDVTITLAQDNRHGSAHEDILSQQITRFRENLPLTVTNSSEPWPITWRELQNAWMEAFASVAQAAGSPPPMSKSESKWLSSPDAVEQDIAAPNHAAFQFAQALDPDQLLLCRTSAPPGKDSPWLMVCGSMRPSAIAEPVSQVVPQVLPETTGEASVPVAVSNVFESSASYSGVGRSARPSTSAVPHPRMTPQALARLQQQQVRQMRVRRLEESRRIKRGLALVQTQQPTPRAVKKRAGTRGWAIPSMLSWVAASLKGGVLGGATAALAAQGTASGS